MNSSESQKLNRSSRRLKEVKKASAFTATALNDAETKQANYKHDERQALLTGSEKAASHTRRPFAVTSCDASLVRIIGKDTICVHTTPKQGSAVA